MLIKEDKFKDSFNGWIYITDDAIYYQSQVGFKIYKIDTKTMAMNPISMNEFQDINVVGDSIYYRNSSKGHRIYKYDLKTGKDEEISEPIIGRLISDGQYLYYLLNDPETFEYCIYKSDLNGKNKQLINSTEFYMHTMNVDGNNIYFSVVGDGAYKLVPGKPAEKLSDEPFVGYIIIGEKYVYLVNFDLKIVKMIAR